MLLVGACRKTPTPNYHWYKSPSGWMLDSIGGGGKGTIAFDERTDHTTGLTAAGVPSGTPIEIGTLHATFEKPDSIVMLDIRKAIGPTPLAVFDADAPPDDEHHPALSDAGLLYKGDCGSAIRPTPTRARTISETRTRYDRRVFKPRSG